MKQDDEAHIKEVGRLVKRTVELGMALAELVEKAEAFLDCPYGQRPGLEQATIKAKALLPEEKDAPT